MEIKEVCARCGRSKAAEEEADVLIEKIKEQKAMKDTVVRLEEYVQHELGGPLPAVTVITSDGTVRSLESLCAEPQGTFKGCTQRVAALISDIFGKKMRKSKE